MNAVSPAPLPAARSARSPLTAARAAFALLALFATAATAAAEPFVYVLGRVPGSPWQQRLTVVDAATNTKGPRINLGASNGFVMPHAMAISPDGSRVFVINDFDETISVVSTASRTVEDTWPAELVGTRPRAIAVSPDGARLYIIGNHQQFYVVDIASRRRIATVTHNQGGSYGIAASPDGSRVYVMATGGDRVAVFGTAPYALLRTVPLDGFYLRSDSLSLSANGRFVYVPRREDLGENEIPIFPLTPPHVVVIDTASNAIVARTDIDHESYHVGVSPTGNAIYIPSYGFNGRLLRLSPTTHGVTNATPLRDGLATAFLPGGGRAYVAATANLTVVDTAADNVVATIPFASAVDGRVIGVVADPPPPPPPPSNLRASAVGNRLTLTWNAPNPSGTVTGYALEGGFAPGQVLASVPTGSTATTFTIDAPSGALYVRMHALSASGRSRASNEVLVLVNVPRAPSPPSALLGLVNGSSLQLSWTNTTDGGTPASLLLDVSGSFNGTLPIPLGETFAFNGVPPGTYTLSLRAVNGVGASVASPPVTLTFPSACQGPPQPPQHFAVSRSGSQLSVRWDPPTSGPALSTYVLKVTGAATMTLPMSARSISGSVGPGVYHLAVQAVNACGAGAETAAQTVTVP